MGQAARRFRPRVRRQGDRAEGRGGGPRAGLRNRGHDAADPPQAAGRAPSAGQGHGGLGGLLHLDGLAHLLRPGGGDRMVRLRRAELRPPTIPRARCRTPSTSRARRRATPRASWARTWCCARRPRPTRCARCSNTACRCTSPRRAACSAPTSWTPRTPRCSTSARRSPWTST